MQALTFEQSGPPLEVLELRDVPIPEPGPGEVLVAMRAASISPGDWLFVGGLYPPPYVASFPGQVAGTHGAGIVQEGGGTRFAPGTLVTFDHPGAWAEYVAVPEERLVALPADYPLEKGSQFFNPITAWDLVASSGAEAGDWLVLTAGNSTVSTMALQLAHRKGINTISVVRRAVDAIDLPGLGAAAVIELSSLEGEIGERIATVTGGAGVRAVVDSVGGPVLAELMRTLGLGGQVIIYGGLSQDGYQLHNFDFLLNNAAIRPYAYRYFFDAPGPQDAALLDEITAVTGEAGFVAPVGGFHPLEDFRAAIEASLSRPEQGKRFFQMTA
jgi:NADPH2:quinone reductase